MATSFSTLANTRLTSLVMAQAEAQAEALP